MKNKTGAWNGPFQKGEDNFYNYLLLAEKMKVVRQGVRIPNFSIVKSSN